MTADRVKYPELSPARLNKLKMLSLVTLCASVKVIHTFVIMFSTLYDNRGVFSRRPFVTRTLHLRWIWAMWKPWKS